MVLVRIDAQPWIYIHPFDIDHAEKEWRMADTAAWVSLLLWFNRRGTIQKLNSLKADFADRTFCEAAATFAKDGGRR